MIEGVLCGACNQTIKPRRLTLCCNGFCGRCYHLPCTDVPLELYHSVRKYKSFSWTCNACCRQLKSWKAKSANEVVVEKIKTIIHEMEDKFNTFKNDIIQTSVGKYKELVVRQKKIDPTPLIERVGQEDLSMEEPLYLSIEDVKKPIGDYKESVLEQKYIEHCPLNEHMDDQRSLTVENPLCPDIQDVNKSSEELVIDQKAAESSLANKRTDSDDDENFTVEKPLYSNIEELKESVEECNELVVAQKPAKLSLVFERVNDHVDSTVQMPLYLTVEEILTMDGRSCFPNVSI
ncbi:hypothetical protein NQ318_001103 [Aromia moschata]|uniref:PHD-type domain-containing protein n=1 Tax=Aromia moschata TaxID=1265417 RepID=A0AAV8ZH65_9CUCU|nr:hypothetical protein NQ318_001103 [Aromia moschata]